MTNWWQNSVFYQIYPRSFQDSNHDGIGDIPGIIQRLPYLAKLGVDALWLSPIFSSPNVDNGYDISNYQDIMPEFGTIADVTELIAKAKSMKIRIIIDLVVNHTSNQHPWFQKALQGDSHFQDYYIFRDAKNKNVPNELQSFFGGSAWEYAPQLDKYYFHLFAKEQPDLNWQNPHVRQEVWKIMRFWRDQGVDGFRLDVIDLIGKDPDKKVIGNGQMLHPYLHEMYEEVLAGTDLVTIGEAGSVTPEVAPLYISPEREELSTVFQFQHMALDEVLGKSKWCLRPLEVSQLKDVINRWQTVLPSNTWYSLFWSNHDQPRILSRWGNPQVYPEKSGKMLAILLHMLRGIPFIYQGEEIGMTNQHVENVEQLNDVESINFYHEQLALGKSAAEALQAINVKGRDNARTPMQWSNALNAGFTSSKPWYPVNPNYLTINVENELQNQNSLFYTYQKLIQLRKQNPIITYGTFSLLETSAKLFAYTRTLKNEKWLICANFSTEKQQFRTEEHLGETIISNYDKAYQEKKIIDLEPYETFVVKII